MKLYVMLLASMIVLLCRQIEASDKADKAFLGKKEKAARARQISHENQWKLLSVNPQQNGDRIYKIYDPGFGYKRIICKADQTFDVAWVA